MKQYAVLLLCLLLFLVFAGCGRQAAGHSESPVNSVGLPESELQSDSAESKTSLFDQEEASNSGSEYQAPAVSSGESVSSVKLPVSSRECEHTYNSKITAPTCAASGYTVYTCVKCGHSYQGNSVKAKGHAFGAWKIEQEPTAAAAGKKSRICSVCGATEKESIPKVADQSDLRIRVFNLVNAERAKNNLPAYTYRDEFQAGADLRAKEIVINFSHTRPDGTVCFTAFPDTYTSAGENIAKFQTTPEQVMESWMNSPPHRASILSEKYTGMAVGIALVDGKYYWTQFFVN